MKNTEQGINQGPIQEALESTERWKRLDAALDMDSGPMERLLNTSDRWTRIVDARDQFGVPTDPLGMDACSFCGYGALRRCYPLFRDREIAGQKLAASICNFWESPSSLKSWIGVVMAYNDHPDTSFKDMQNAIGRAGI